MYKTRRQHPPNDQPCEHLPQELKQATGKGFNKKGGVDKTKIKEAAQNKGGKPEGYSSIGVNNLLIYFSLRMCQKDLSILPLHLSFCICLLR